MTTRGVGLSEEEREALVEALAMDLMAEEHVGRADLRMHPLEWHWSERFSDDDREEYRSLARAALRSPVLAAHTADLAAQVAAGVHQFEKRAGKAHDYDGNLAGYYIDAGTWREIRAALSPAQPDTERGGGS